MSSKQSSAIALLIEKYEGNKGVSEGGNVTNYITFANEEIASPNLESRSLSRRTDSRRSNVSSIRTSSLHQSTSVRNISFSFPPANAFFLATVGIV